MNFNVGGTFDTTTATQNVAAALKAIDSLFESNQTYSDNNTMLNKKVQNQKDAIKTSTAQIESLKASHASELKSLKARLEEERAELIESHQDALAALAEEHQIEINELEYKIAEGTAVQVATQNLCNKFEQEVGALKEELATTKRAIVKLNEDLASASSLITQFTAGVSGTYFIPPRAISSLFLIICTRVCVYVFCVRGG